MNTFYKIKFQIILIATAIIFDTINLNGQGNTPCTATNITANTTCIITAGTTLPATYASNAANGGVPSCANPGAPDVWYSFTALSTGNFVITTSAGTITDGGLSLYSATSCGVGMVQIACNDDGGPNSPMSQITAALTTGTTYYIRVWRYGSGTGTFGICITSPSPPPTNDNPTGAIAITPAASCSYTTFTNSGATATSCGTIPAPGCASYSGGDVWFSIIVPASGGFILDSNTGVITDGGMAVYSGVACGVMSLISCDDDASPNGLMPMLTIAGQTPGATLFIRFWEYGNDNNGTFRICATTYTPPTPPSNNNPCGAAPVTVNPSLTCTSQANGNVAGATSSTVGLGACFGNPDDDVWYSFVATGAAHNVSINNITGSATDMYFSVHPGPCGAIGAAIICSDPNSNSFTGLIAGTTYFIRVYTFTSGPQTTTFSVCVTTPGPSSSNVDCSGSVGICGNASISGNSSGEGIEELNAGNQGCLALGGEMQSSWYFFKILTAGTLSFTLTTTVDYDFAIWGPYSPTANPTTICPVVGAPLRCSFAAGGGNTGLGNGAVDLSEGSGGNRWVAPIAVTAGQVFEILINNFVADLSSFTLNWGGSATLDCTVLIPTPIELLSFSGKNEDQQNVITWNTATEINNDFFTLEKSKDGIAFETLTTVKGAGNSSQMKSYFSVDKTPSDITYYRLKQTDYNKDFKYSQIISVDLINGQDKISNVYPNPTNNNIMIDITSMKKNNVTVTLFDNTGSKIINEQKQLDIGVNAINFNLENYKAGVYLLKVYFESTGKSEIKKIIKR